MSFHEQHDYAIGELVNNVDSKYDEDKAIYIGFGYDYNSDTTEQHKLFRAGYNRFSRPGYGLWNKPFYVDSVGHTFFVDERMWTQEIEKGSPIMDDRRHIQGILSESKAQGLIGEHPETYATRINKERYFLICDLLQVDIFCDYLCCLY